LEIQLTDYFKTGPVVQESLGRAVSPKDLKRELVRQGTMALSELEEIFSLITIKDPNTIYEHDFSNGSRAFASFKAVDIEGAGSLDLKELKTLLWLCNGEEPSEERVQLEKKLMD